ncbi:hypothetical protein JVU11DRAFT_7619 [Chiua virens]|nr:hypothetical protein JVU11DRAFT_7619 [Chiua virens]
MTKMLKSLKRELENVQKVVMKISSRGSILRFFLHDADVQAITACTASIKAAYTKIEVKFAIDNRQAVARLEDQLEEIRKDMTLRQCQCRAVVHEERENGEPSAVAATSQGL